MKGNIDIEQPKIITTSAGGTGVSSFLGLEDTPAAYVANTIPQVNAGSGTVVSSVGASTGYGLSEIISW